MDELERSIALVDDTVDQLISQHSAICGWCGEPIRTLYEFAEHVVECAPKLEVDHAYR